MTLAASTWQWLALATAITLAVYAAFVLCLLVVGRRDDARALAGFVPDCVVLFRRLLGDPRVPRSRKLLIGALIAYVAMPFDLVPDFIPVAGQLDDAIVVVLVLRAIARSGGRELLREHWPGPAGSLTAVPDRGDRLPDARAGRIRVDARDQGHAVIRSIPVLLLPPREAGARKRWPPASTASWPSRSARLACWSRSRGHLITSACDRAAARRRRPSPATSPCRSAARSSSG